MDLSALCEAPCVVFLDTCKKDLLVEIAVRDGFALQEI